MLAEMTVILPETPELIWGLVVLLLVLGLIILIVVLIMRAVPMRDHSVDATSRMERLEARVAELEDKDRRA